MESSPAPFCWTQEGQFFKPIDVPRRVPEVRCEAGIHQLMPYMARHPGPSFGKCVRCAKMQKQANGAQHRSVARHKKARRIAELQRSFVGSRVPLLQLKNGGNRTSWLRGAGFGSSLGIVPGEPVVSELVFLDAGISF